jgi:hypothetical protein
MDGVMEILNKNNKFFLACSVLGARQIGKSF